ncbi:DNA polymerase III subunit delta' [Iodidimonas muriae]|uniref:DNA polymerase III subunit delta n=1 Tax=Iodidimonas muriae TaxID=261467 RepID=A0ABQ2L821_9PROT|nr:DNA polymerase III subunit delta' [Iodidimonas muriae]GER08183.1 DNA polymerase III subunit delta' [Kordiimonadales bacterium JCM 17843]GGO06374.1 DNA polymerase III subunit delta' [Iodidimonas muriae]
MAPRHTAVPDLDPLDPRLTEHLVGHEQAERAFLDAFASRRMHHAWLITGPKGVGKATLAWRIARYLLRESQKQTGQAQQQAMGPSLFGDDEPIKESQEPAQSLEMAAEDPLFQRIAKGGHGNLMCIERGWDERKKQWRGDILVDDVRKVQALFGRTASEDGWRVCIVDSADELNRNAANALLKILEEPPEKGLLLLVAHAPGRLLPTIRSRCRKVALQPLPDTGVEAVLQKAFPDMDPSDSLALARLAQGAPGRAVSLAQGKGLVHYRDLVALLKTMPGISIPDAYKFAGRFALKSADADYKTVTALLLMWVETMVRAAGIGETALEIVEGEAAIRQRFISALGLDRWVELWEKMGRLIMRADAVHLDRKQVLISLLMMLDDAAQGRFSA